MASWIIFLDQKTDVFKTIKDFNREELERVAGLGSSDSRSSKRSPCPLRIMILVLIYGGHKLDSRFIYERTFARLLGPDDKVPPGNGA